MHQIHRKPKNPGMEIPQWEYVEQHESEQAAYLRVGQLERLNPEFWFRVVRS